MPRLDTLSKQAADALISRMQKTIQPHLDAKIGNAIPNAKGELSSGLSVKEAKAQLKTAIEEIASIKATLKEFIFSENYDRISGQEFTAVEGRSWANPDIELMKAADRLNQSIQKAQGGIAMLDATHKDDLALVSDFKLVQERNPQSAGRISAQEKAIMRDLGIEVPSTPASAKFQFVPEEPRNAKHDRDGNRIMKDPGNKARVNSWWSTHRDIKPVEGGKVKFNTQAVAHEYQSSRVAARDFSWKEGLENQAHQKSYIVDTKTVDATINDIDSNGISERGTTKTHSQKSEQFDPVSYLNSEWFSIAKDLAEKEVDFHNLDDNPEQRAREESVKGGAVGAHQRALRQEQEALSTLPLADARAEGKLRAAAAKDLASHGYAPIVPKKYDETDV